LSADCSDAPPCAVLGVLHSLGYVRGLGISRNALEPGRKQVRELDEAKFCFAASGNPVGGATDVQYTRRSADGKVLRRVLTGIRDREVDFGQVLRRAAGKELPSARHWVERTRATEPRQRKQIWDRSAYVSTRTQIKWYNNSVRNSLYWWLSGLTIV